MRELLFTVIILFLFHSKGNAQQYNFRNYNVEDGLGQSQVYAMHEDRTGRIWLGTRGSGISIFDGFDFKNITTKDGLSSNYINKIVEDSSGIIWIATNNGLSSFNGIEFSKTKLSNKSLVVRDIFILKNTVYCSTNQGLYAIENNTPKSISPELTSNLDIIALHVENEHSFLLGTDKGLLRLHSDKLTHFGEQSSYMNNAITRLKKDHQGKLWIGTYGDGVYCYDQGRFYRIDYQHELYRETIFDIYFHQNDEVWMATLKGGVICYNINTKVFRSISESEGLSNNHVRCILKDRNEQHWFGTSGGGACHYLGQQFTNYDQQSGLAGNYIYSILRDRNNMLWIGNSQRGVSVLTTKGFLRHDETNGFRNVKVKALAEDKHGIIWLGTNGHGVYAYQNDEFKEIDELRSAYVKQMKIDLDGNLWIATAGSGLIKVTNRAGSFLVEKWTTEEGILSNRITTLHFDLKGNLWYGTERNGVGCLNKNRKNILHLTEKDGLTSLLIRSIIEDHKGTLWIGSAGGGVCGYHPKTKRIREIREGKGLKSDNVYLLSIDQQNNVIVGTEKGLDFVSFNEKGIITYTKHYGKLDGFTGVETCQNSVWNDADGSIWFGTINGLCHFKPSELTRNPTPPRLSITDIKIFYESYKNDTSPLLTYGQQVHDITLPYDQNHITFDFLGVNLSRPKDVSYRWKLEGFDKEYAPISKDRSILYSNLNPGEYTFKLIASNEDGIWNSEPLTFSFQIQAPFWKTTWFIIVCVAGVFLILLISYRLSIRRIQRKATERQAKIQLEVDFLELEHKAMRLQMNPHFIFNALNSIQSLIGTGKEKEARYYLAKFSRLMRQILDNSRKNEISLEEEISTLENYLLVEQFCNGTSFTYSILANQLETDFINIPPMLIQPFVENSIKHGMKAGLNREGHIAVYFSEQDGILECTIEDNGIGREKSAELKKDSKETYHTSAGLSVTTERLERIKTEQNINPLEIIDLYQDGKPSGTKVIIRIPID